MYFCCRELVVPMYQYPKNESCTAILNLEMLTWSKLPEEGPFIDSLRYFHLIVDDKKENIFLLGGGQLNKYGENYVSKQPEPVFEIQLLDKNGWHNLDGAKLHYPIQWPAAPIPLDFYQNNNWPKINFKEMKSEGESTVNIDHIKKIQ